MSIDHRNKENAPPRVHHTREYVKWLSVSSALLGFLILLLIIIVNYRVQYEGLHPDVITKYSPFFLFFSIVCFYLSFSYNVLQQYSLQVYPEKLKLKNKDKTIEVNFSDIKEIKLINQSLFNRLLIIDKSGNKIKIPNCLERIEYIVEKFNSFDSNFWTEDYYHKLRSTLISYDHNLARSNDLFLWQFKFITLICYNLAPIVLIILLFFQDDIIALTERATYSIMMLFLVPLILSTSWPLAPLIVNLISNKKMNENYQGTFRNKRRDVEIEKKTYLKLVPLYIVLVILALAASNLFIK